MQIQPVAQTLPEHGLFSHPDTEYTSVKPAFSSAEVAQNRANLFHEPAAAPEVYSNTP
ncbi:hypothetical protein GCM10011609_25590 [Lentzea pudingi]|uniref:Uncharacterized protein n=1 Tax=Lentzea pudingi TaxID=1789439 RepID=A0ABQ2HQJ9_9PSEU|nr:hypothetical protein [Lentzea pudingi]GGM87802.1 hypothetical protein GCM10011609_25590 [Lentzea pudingi]